MHPKTILSFILFTNLIFSQNPGSGVTDADGNVYETLVYGTQEVMKQNLKTSKYCNGDAIENVTDFNLWSNLSTGAWCYYNNDVANNSVYGKLYNFYTVSDSRNVCPCDWHVPTEAEWDVLLNFLGGPGSAQNVGGKMKEAGFAHWQSPNLGATNESNFTALPGGGRFPFSNFYNIGQYCDLWTSTVYDTNNSYKRDLGYSGNVFSGSTNLGKKSGISIRCMKNAPLQQNEFNKETIKVYPNPASDVFSVSLSEIHLPVHYLLNDLTGKLLDEGKLTTTETVIDIHKLNQGVYYLTLTSDNTTLFFKIVKK